MQKKIRMGMVGGSKEGFIGQVHRMAAALDGHITLTCGAFSSNAERSRNTGLELSIPESRIYQDFREMMVQEKLLPEHERMQFVSIVTPNHLHFAPAKLALENGFHVLCEKPLSFDVEQAGILERVVSETKLLFGITHNYTGYPMVKEARSLVRNGALGKLRKVIAEYPQGWLSESIENSGQKQASWRTDPNQAGISCCVADIGTHAENLAEYITDLKITEVAADVSTFLPGRLLDDDANILVRFTNNVNGVILASQVASGEENDLKIRIYGELGSLEWKHSSPNNLTLKNADGSIRILKAGVGNKYLSEHARLHTRVPGGHPEGYIESMANIYRNFAFAVAVVESGISELDPLYDFPTVAEGVRGMKFIEAVISSGKNNSKWTPIN